MHCAQYYHKPTHKELWQSMQNQSTQNLLTVEGGASKVPHLLENLLEVDVCQGKESHSPRDVATGRLVAHVSVDGIHPFACGQH